MIHKKKNKRQSRQSSLPVTQSLCSDLSVTGRSYGADHFLRVVSSELCRCNCGLIHVGRLIKLGFTHVIWRQSAV